MIQMLVVECSSHFSSQLNQDHLADLSPNDIQFFCHISVDVMYMILVSKGTAHRLLSTRKKRACN